MLESVRIENNSTLRVLHHLREVDRRRLFSKLKFKSLVDYAEKRLGYPYDQAWRRIEAMRLLKEMPEIETKIAGGTLNLTNIGYAQAAFKAEAKKNVPLCKDDKLEFLLQIENKSTRATQKLVVEKFGDETLIRETVKPVGATLSMLNVPVTDEFLAKLEELKGLLAHSQPNASNAELLDYAVSSALANARDKKMLTLKRTANHKTSTVVQASSHVDANTASEAKVAAPRKSNINNESKNLENCSRYVPAKVQRDVWGRDQGKCSNCESTYKLEIDHRLPFGKNGRATRENLRLLCRNCNQRAAIESYGVNKMSRYLKEPACDYLAGYAQLI